jgi:hypothetical protein
MKMVYLEFYNHLFITKSEIDRLRKEEEFKDFKEFCKSNLAFLIDAGFTVDVSYAMYGGGFMLEVMRKETVYLTGKK